MSKKIDKLQTKFYGYRNFTEGVFFFIDDEENYWMPDIVENKARNIVFRGNMLHYHLSDKSLGFSVRCTFQE